VAAKAVIIRAPKGVREDDGSPSSTTREAELALPPTPESECVARQRSKAGDGFRASDSFCSTSQIKFTMVVVSIVSRAPNPEQPCVFR
jgi:hypothetical protein